MKKLFLITLLLIIAGALWSQTDIVIKSKSSKPYADIDTLYGVKNKTLRSESDTLYVINRNGVSAFYKCAADLQRVKNLTPFLDSVAVNLNTLSIDINSMYGNMKEVTEFVKNYSNDTKLKLTTLETNNIKLDENLKRVEINLAVAEEQLKAQRKKNIGTCLLWGAGGITVGGLVVGLLMLAK